MQQSSLMNFKVWIQFQLRKMTKKKLRRAQLVCDFYSSSHQFATADAPRTLSLGFKVELSSRIPQDELILLVFNCYRRIWGNDK